MKSVQIITYADDFCFDCEVPCKKKDKAHKYHSRLSNRKERKITYAERYYAFLTRNNLPLDTGGELQDAIMLYLRTNEDG